MLIALLCTREFDILAQALLDAPPRGPVRLPYGFARGSTPTPGCAELEPHARRRAMNHLIASLPEAARSLLEPSLEPVPLRPADILHQIGGSVDYVYFPSSGMVSLVVTMESGQTADTSIIGREGMVCSAIVFDVHHAMDQATVAVAGQAMRIRTPDFTTAYKANEPLRSVVNRYHALMLAEARHSIACTALHNVEQRLCRWLAEAMDRACRDELPVTHEFLARMLGVQRSTISAVCPPLMDEGIISYGRGNMKILDAKRLRARACECYRILRQRAELVFPEWLPTSVSAE
jgi:CRP-like cAMP-binding protein